MTTTSTETLERFASSDEPAAYLFSKYKLANNTSSILNAFHSFYSGVFLAYSFKTNYLKQICDHMRLEGHMAEVVSPAEYDYARSLGFPENMIVYNGVIPDTVEKLSVAAGGGFVNVDNYGEYRELSRVAGITKTPIRIGVRVNFDVGNGIVSRFGVDVESLEFRILMNDIKKDPHVRFGGFHTHIGSARQIEYWERKTDRMIELAREYRAPYIDLGGGMFGQMPDSLSSQFNGYVGDFTEYAKATARKMNEAFPRNEVDLIIEPGTAVVGNTMKVVAKVTNIKIVRGKTYVTVGCCSNHIGMLCECRDIPVTVFKSHEVSMERINVEHATICGDTCLEFDYIKKDFAGSILPGDVLIFENCGAYSISASRQFIVPRLPVYDEDTGELLKAGETSGDMLARYSNPAKSLRK